MTNPIFTLEEATIDQLQSAIKARQVSCVEVVQRYIDRCRLYNGVATQLVTARGEALAEQPAGAVRAGQPLNFPRQTVAASEFLPDLDRYQGPPLDFGRMAATASDPEVQQQFGMVQGIPQAGQLNALSTLNIRGERSVTCRGDYDLHPSLGPLPPGAPPACEIFRHHPDALEQAAALDAQWGSNPDLQEMPLYGVVFSFKDAFDTKDMRTTGGADAQYDIDFPALDHLLVEQLRKKGAIIFAKALMTEYNGRAGDPGGKHQPNAIFPSLLGYQRSTWAGTPVNPYDTTRSASLGSSSGSGVSVSANLVMASLGEETRMSTRGPANHNAVALILPHKAMLGFDGGAIGADIYCDRTGILCRSLTDCAKVLDALKDPENGYYDPRDPYTTVPRSSVLDNYSQHIPRGVQAGALRGLRLGVIRESMLSAGSKAAEPITQAAAREIQAVLADHLQATLVESSDPLWTPDPRCERMSVDYRTALAKLVPVFMPELLFRLNPDGSPVFPDFAKSIERTEFAPGVFHGQGTMRPIDYLVALADLRIEPPSNLDISTVQQQMLANTFRYHISQYLSRRSDDWAALGMTETLKDWRTLNQRSAFWGDDHRAAFKNWEDVRDPRNPLGGRQGVDERIMLRELLRRVDMMVIYENRLDAVVRLHTPLPPGVIGGADEPGLIDRLRYEHFFGPNAGLSEMLVPAGYVDVAYDAKFMLSRDAQSYQFAANDQPTRLPAPGLPFSLVFRTEPGREDVALRIASSYEQASARRVSPPQFP
jgi:Asp-tRNA(Asn)/Glu-tRNA(Gln) amidotransferase A subunit family amidase